MLDKMDKEFRLILSLLWLLPALAGRANADGVIRDSVGALSSGRGGTNIAHSDNGAVILSNPAGMVNAPAGNLFEFSFDGLVPDLEYADPQNNAENKPVLFGLPELAYIHRPDPQSRWAAGIGVFIPAGFGAEWELVAPPPIFGTRTYRSLGGLAKILPAAAYKVTDRLSVGASLGVAISHVELEGPFFVQTGPLQGVPTLLDLRSTGASVAWSIGTQYQVTERTTLGLVYTSENRFEMNGDAEATIFAPPAPFRTDLDAEVDLTWPRSVGVGLTHWLACQHRLSLDVLWFDWSDAFDELGVTFTDSSHPALDPVIPYEDRFPLRWKDSVSVRVGHEYFLTPCDVLRLGYVYNSPTVPNSTLTPYIPATLEHSFSVGYGKSWNTFRVDVAYQFAFGPTQTVDNSAIVGGDFDQSRTKAQAHFFYIGLSKRF